MTEEAFSTAVTTVEQDRTDYDRYTSYEDGDATVVCDRKNPNAWIRSDETAPLDV